MNKVRLLKIIARWGLFSLILIAGAVFALVVDETRGLARIDLTDSAARTVTVTGQGDLLYAAGSQPEGSGFFRSIDNGRTWYMVSQGPQTTVSALAIHPGNEATLYAGGPGGKADAAHNLWWSKNKGQTWRPYPLNLPANSAGHLPAVTALAVDPAHPDWLYVGTAGQGVYRVEAGQPGYELVGGLSLYNDHVKSLVVGAGSHLYALTQEGLFKAEADTWQKLSPPDSPASVAAAAYTPQTLYIGTVSTGVYRSRDAGQSWEPINQGLDMRPGAALRVTALAVDDQNPNHLAVAVAYGLGGQFAPGPVYHSYHAGEEWLILAAPDKLVTNLTIHQGAVYAATDQGLLHFDGPLAKAEVEPDSLVAGLRSLLVNPSGTQTLILLLTVILSGLILLSPVEWLARLRRVYERSR